MTTTPHGSLYWKINDIHRKLQPGDSNHLMSLTKDITLTNTNSTSMMGEVMYTSMATILNVHTKTTIICSDGEIRQGLVFNLISMLINFSLYI